MRRQEQTPRQTARARAKSPENCGSCRARHLMLRLQVERESLFDPPFELIAHITVCLQSVRAFALDKGRIEGIPELVVAGHGSGQFDRLVLALRRQRDDEVEGRVLQVVEGLRPMPREVDADLVHHLYDEGVELATAHADRSEEHTSELQSLMRISYAVFCLKKNKIHHNHNNDIKKQLT